MSSALLVAVSALSIVSAQAAPDVFSCFVLFANHYLEKSGTTVTRNVSSVAVCLEQCLSAQKSGTLQCRSVMWKKTTSDCILSRWSIAQRPKHVRISQRLNVDLYENNCYGDEHTTTIYTTSEQTMTRTTTIPRSEEDTLTTSLTTAVPFTKVTKMELTTDFRRFRAHHSRLVCLTLKGQRARSLRTNPLPQQAFHRVDGESDAPQSTEKIPVGPEKDTEARGELNFQMKPKNFSNTDEVTVSSQLDDLSTIETVGGMPIRKGKIIPHAVPPPEITTTEPPRISHSLVPIAQSLPTVPTTLPPPAGPTVPFVIPSRPSPCFVRVRGYVLPDFEEKTIQATVRQCLLACLRSASFFCASVNYHEAQRICVLSGGNVKLNNATLSQQIGFDYFENKCHLGDRDEQLDGVVTTLPTREITAPTCFQQRKDVVLASLDAMVVRHLSNLGECISSCTASAIPCTGLNWIPSTSGCMLFHGEIDVSQIADAQGSYFYFNNCSGKILVSNRKATKGKNVDYYDQEG